MGTKNNPGAFDCYGNAEPDEPMFILLGRDAHAARAVELWADDREFAILLGEKPETDRAMVDEARQCARAMRDWRRQHRPTSEFEQARGRRDFADWASDEQGWDTDTGAPGIVLFSNALQVWATSQPHARVSVAAAALAFNLAPTRIIEAVESHPWMFLTGPRDDFRALMIEHEGE